MICACISCADEEASKHVDPDWTFGDVLQRTIKVLGEPRQPRDVNVCLKQLTCAPIKALSMLGYGSEQHVANKHLAHKVFIPDHDNKCVLRECFGRLTVGHVKYEALSLLGPPKNAPDVPIQALRARATTITETLELLGYTDVLLSDKQRLQDELAIVRL